MAANTSPIFSRLADIQWVTGSVLTANTTKTLAAGTVFLVFTADATNGGYVDKVIAKPLGTNVATVLRLWINNGSSTGTAANNAMIADETLAATTNSEVAAISETEITLNMALPAGYRIYATIGTTVTAGFDITAIGGKY